MLWNADGAYDDSDDEDEHFGEGVFSDTAVRRKIINQVCMCATGCCPGWVKSMPGVSVSPVSPLAVVQQPDVWDERAKLPHGIKQIERHLEVRSPACQTFVVH